MKPKRLEAKFAGLKSALLGCALVTALSVVSLSASAQEIPFDPNAGGGGDAGAAAPAENPPAEAPAPVHNAPASGGTASDTNPYTELENQPGTPPPPQVSAPAPTTAAPAGGSRVPRLTPGELSGLGKLAPFSDIAVISKRYLPKTHRFEIFPNVGAVLNDAFFSDYIFGVRAGYYFSENWGIEAAYMSISSSQKSVTDELQQIRGIQTQSLATPTGYMGGAIKWDPIYGKLGFMDNKIVPFDFYFLVGAGITSTNQSTSPATLHLGAGQIFAIRKWMAARWDISWFAYNSTTTVGNQGSGTFTNLHATLGLSFFFPKAEYR